MSNPTTIFRISSATEKGGSRPQIPPVGQLHIFVCLLMWGFCHGWWVAERVELELSSVEGKHLTQRDWDQIRVKIGWKNFGRKAAKLRPRVGS